MEFLKTATRKTIIEAIIYAVIGLFFIIMPNIAIDVIGKIIAVTILAIGIVETILYFLNRDYENGQRGSFAFGIVAIIVGVFLLIKSTVAADIAGYILAFIIIVSSVLEFQYALDLMHFKSKNFIASLIMGVIGLTLGIIALINPFSATKTLMIVIGVSLVAVAIFTFISAMLFRACLKDMKAETPAIEGEVEVIEVTTENESE